VSAVAHAIEDPSGAMVTVLARLAVASSCAERVSAINRGKRCQGDGRCRSASETQLLGPHTLKVVMRYAHLSQSHELAAVERLCKTGEGDEKEMTPAQDRSR
jgi:hypothetical protein